MSYISKTKREETLWFTRTELIDHVQSVEGKNCTESEACRQIAEAIEDRELPVVWADMLKIFWKSGGSGWAIQIADKASRDAKFWQQGPFDSADPQKGQIDPADPDRVFVRWDFDFDEPDVRGPVFRKPMFWRARAENIWRLPNATTADEKKATELLAEYLRSDPELLHDKALSICREKFTLSKRGFHERVWRDARVLAGLPAKGKAGRRKAPQ